MYSKFIVIAVLGTAVAACATVARGTSEQVAFDTVPSGAEVRAAVEVPVIREGEVAAPSPAMGCVTPCVLQVKRYDKLAVTITKPGFETESFSLAPKASGEGVGTSLVGNAIIGGVIGLAVDGVSGAGLDKCPNPVRIQLRPLDVRTRSRNVAAQPNRFGFDVEAECKVQTAEKYKARENTSVTTDPMN